MRVIRAEAMGMCFGVRDALELAFADPTPTDVTVHEPSAAPLWVQAQPARSVAAPGERVPVDVVVRTSAGAPVQGALVRWTSESEDPETERRTDAAGRVRLEWLLARSTSEPVQNGSPALFAS